MSITLDADRLKPQKRLLTIMTSKLDIRMETERLLQNNKEDEWIVSSKPDCTKLLDLCNLKALCNQACLIQSIFCQTPLFQIFMSKLSNMFVQIAKFTCPHFDIYLSES